MLTELNNWNNKTSEKSKPQRRQACGLGNLHSRLDGDETPSPWIEAGRALRPCSQLERQCGEQLPVLHLFGACFN